MRLGNYEAALKGFENTIKIKNDHAFAYYFAAKCYQKLNNHVCYIKYKTICQKIISESEFWSKYALKFDLLGL